MKCLNFHSESIVEFLFGEIKRHALTRPTGQRADTRARAGGRAIVVICQGALAAAAAAAAGHIVTVRNCGHSCIAN